MPDRQSGNGRIALFARYNYLDSYAFMRDALSILCEHGYQVDMYVGPAVVRSMYKTKGLAMLSRPEAFPFFAGNYPRWIQKLRRGGRFYAWLAVRFYYP